MQGRAAIQLRHYCPTTEVLCFMTKKSKYLKNIATSNRVTAHAPSLWIFHTRRPLQLFFRDVSSGRKSFGLGWQRLVTTT